LSLKSRGTGSGYESGDVGGKSENSGRLQERGWEKTKERDHGKRPWSMVIIQYDETIDIFSGAGIIHKAARKNVIPLSVFPFPGLRGPAFCFSSPIYVYFGEKIRKIPYRL
jgi:hypothetical protein